MTSPLLYLTQVAVGQESDAVDSYGISEWDKVDVLLLKHRGQAITNREADDIICLYEDTAKFDKRPLVFERRPLAKPHGRFVRSKENWSGHIDRTMISGESYVLPSSVFECCCFTL